MTILKESIPVVVGIGVLALLLALSIWAGTRAARCGETLISRGQTVRITTA